MKQLTILVHIDFKTFGESTSPALVPVCFIYRAAPFSNALGLASVLSTFVNASFEKP